MSGFLRYFIAVFNIYKCEVDLFLTSGTQILVNSFLFVKTLAFIKVDLQT